MINVLNWFHVSPQQIKLGRLILGAVNENVLIAIADNVVSEDILPVGVCIGLFEGIVQTVDLFKRSELSTEEKYFVERNSVCEFDSIVVE